MDDGYPKKILVYKIVVGEEQNFEDEEGNTVEWEEAIGSHQKIRDAMDRNLNKIPPDTRGEIADVIRGASNIDQD